MTRTAAEYIICTLNQTPDPTLPGPRLPMAEQIRLLEAALAGERQRCCDVVRRGWASGTLTEIETEIMGGGV